MKQPAHPSGADHWTHRTPDRVRRGASAPGAKLSEQQVAELCADFRAGSRNKSWLARKYGVTRVTVWRQLRAASLL